MKIKDLAEWFGQNWLGLIGIALAVILFIQSRNIIKLSAQFKTIPLIEHDSHGFLRGIEIKYKGIDIPQLTLTKVYIWNSGRQTIDAKHIVIDDQLRIFFSKDVKIIKAEIAADTRKVNKASIKISEDGTSVLIYFDFFDPEDGIRVDILHTGKELFPSFRGTIKGMPKGIEIVSKRSQVFNKRPSDWLSLIALDYFLFFSLFFYILGWVPGGVFKKLLRNDITMNQSRTIQLCIVIVGFLFFLIWVWGLYYSPALDRYPSALETSTKKII